MPNHSYGIQKMLLNKIRLFFQKGLPRYFLSLDSKNFNQKTKNIDYRFKTFGEHSFPVFSYEKIIENKNILYSINPFDLINIAVEEYKQVVANEQYQIAAFIRGYKYKLINSYSEITLTGSEICNNPNLLEKISQVNICKIAFETGFFEGRNLSKQLLLEKETISKQNIHPLRLVKNQLGETVE